MDNNENTRPVCSCCGATMLDLDIYRPSHYILPSRIAKYEALYDKNKVSSGLTQVNREQGIRRLMAINLMKRMESSVYSFNLTLKRIRELIESTIRKIDTFDKGVGLQLELNDITDRESLDYDDMESEELFTFGRKVRIDLVDMDYVSWKRSLVHDKEILDLITINVEDITPQYDCKLQKLLSVLSDKITKLIKEQKATTIVDHITYTESAEEPYDNSIFTASKGALDYEAASCKGLH